MPKLNKKLICILFSYTILFLPLPSLASDYTVTINTAKQQIMLDNTGSHRYIPPVLLTYDNAKDIQAMLLENNGTTYLVVALWNSNKILLSLYNTTGTLLNSIEAFSANIDKGKDFSLFRLESIINDDQFLLQLRTIKTTYGEPTKWFKKHYSFNPTIESVFTLTENNKHDIKYPNLSKYDNELAGLKLLNFERLAAGLLPVKRNDTLDSGCEKHVEYMRLNEILTHYEEVGKPGYTTAGAEAGMNSDLAGQRSTSMSVGIELWTTAIYHRFPLIKTGLKTVGWAASAKSGAGYYYTCINVYGDADLYALSGSDLNKTFYDVDNFAPIAYPGYNQKHVPPDFSSGETPDPLAAFGGDYPAGQPVSLSFPTTDTITNSTMTLTDEAGKAVSGYFRAPNDPTDPNKQYQGNAITFIASSPLKAATTYKVKVTAKRNNENYAKEWQFRTE
ncbi:MAG: CAP domain-containing protein [Patescibacteria group bacterium]|jgi:hypothetical protein